jgi:hypothetical protein
LLAALAAQWLGGSAVLLDPLDEAAEQVSLLRRLGGRFVFAEGQQDVERVQAAGLAPGLLFHADGRGLFDVSLATYATLLGRAADPALVVQARPEGVAFSFYRVAAGELQAQRLTHGELLTGGQGLVTAERLGAREEALAARTFAASGQVRYLLAPWLLAGFRLNFPESLATRARDRRELGPTLVLGTARTYGHLHALIQQRLPLPGSLSRRLVDWALAPSRGAWQRLLGHWLIGRPLRDQLGLGRTRVPLLTGAPLEPQPQVFFAVLGVPPRPWPEAHRWQPAGDDTPLTALPGDRLQIA